MIRMPATLKTCPGLSTIKQGLCRRCKGAAAVFWLVERRCFVLACTRCYGLDIDTAVLAAGAE